MGETTEELKQNIGETRSQMSGTLEAIGDRMSPGRMLERRRNRVVVWFRIAKDRVMGTADELTSRASDTAHQVGDAPESIVTGMKEGTKGSPLIAGATAFGVGVLLGSAFPASRAERRLGQQTMQATESLKGELLEAGRDMAEHLREPVREAVDDVKETATQGARDVKETAQESAEQVSDKPR